MKRPRLVYIYEIKALHWGLDSSKFAAVPICGKQLSRLVHKCLVDQRHDSNQEFNSHPLTGRQTITVGAIKPGDTNFFQIHIAYQNLDIS